MKDVLFIYTTIVLLGAMFLVHCVAHLQYKIQRYANRKCNERLAEEFCFLMGAEDLDTSSMSSRELSLTVKALRVNLERCIELPEEDKCEQ